MSEYATEESDTQETNDGSQDESRYCSPKPLNRRTIISQQQIRHCLIDRWITQGKRGDAGMLYHERTWTMIATCQNEK
jgi:hypothetical protein